MKSSDIHGKLVVELLFLCFESSQYSWFMYMTWKSPGCLSLEVLQHVQLGGDLGVDQEAAGTIMYLIWPENTSPRRAGSETDVWNTLLSPEPDLR